MVTFLRTKTEALLHGALLFLHQVQPPLKHFVFKILKVPTDSIWFIKIQ